MYNSCKKIFFEKTPVFKKKVFFKFLIKINVNNRLRYAIKTSGTCRKVKTLQPDIRKLQRGLCIFRSCSPSISLGC